MTTLPDVIELTAEEEARRLWEGVRTARESAREDLVSLFQAVELGCRAVEVLAAHRLQGVKDRFPATIGLLLETPVPEVDPQRDSIPGHSSLDFTEVLDLVSEETLSCVAPGMHRGWEDRRFACRRSRVTARDALGVSLDAAARANLLTLAAYRNRLFRHPPPVRVVTGEITRGFADLEALVGGLLP
jgi:hypothetical protein